MTRLFDFQMRRCAVKDLLMVPDARKHPRKHPCVYRSGMTRIQRQPRLQKYTYIRPIPYLEESPHY